MNKMYAIILLMLPFGVFAQQHAVDSLGQAMPINAIDSVTYPHDTIVIDSLKEQTLLADSLKQPQKSAKTNSLDSLTIIRVDSLTTKLTRLNNLKIKVPGTQLVDSLKKLKIKDPTQVLKAELDSLKPKELLATKDSVLTQVKQANVKINSTVAAINAAPQKMVNNLQSKAQNGINNLVKKPEEKVKEAVNKPNELAKQVEQKPKELTQKLTKERDKLLPIDSISVNALSKSLPKKLTSNIPKLGIEKTVKDKLDLPKVDTQKLGLGKIETPKLALGKVETEKLGIPKLEVGKLGSDKLLKGNSSLDKKVNGKLIDSTAMGGLNLNILPKELSLKNLKINEKVKETTNVDIDKDVKGSLNKVKAYTNNPLKELGKAEELKEVSKNMAEVKKVSGQVEGYSKEIENFKEGDFSAIDKNLEKQLASRAELKELTQQKALVQKYYDQQKLQIEGFEAYKDKKVLAAAAMEKGGAIAIGHFGANQKQLMEAHKMLAQLKKGYSYVPSLEEVKENKPNRLTRKPFIDRVVFGVDFEIGLLKDTKTFDVAPFIGCRINEHISIYGGYVWKFGVQDKDSLSIEQSPIQGVRGTFNYLIMKGFSATAIIEQLNESVVVDGGKVINNRYEGYMLGITKSYRIVKNFNGQAQILYNFGYKKSSPYKNPVNIRFGFYFNTKSEDKNRKRFKSSR